MNDTSKMNDHAARPRPDTSGRRPISGRQPCAVCGQTVARVGAHRASDGGRGYWKHVVRAALPPVETGGYVKDGVAHETFRTRKVIAEFVDRDGGYWISCDEDGQTREYSNPALIVAEIRHADAVASRKGVSTVTTIDWLNVPAGFTPPSAVQ